MVKDKRSQTSDVLNYMKKNGSITSMEAFKKFGATRLSGLIFSLRKQGYEIETQSTECVTRYGTTVRYAKYIYRGEE